MNRFSYDGTYNGVDGMAHNGQGGPNDMMLMMMNEENNMDGGQSLDDIVSQNDKVIRRQSLPQHYGATGNRMDGDMRRVSMMDYNSGPSGGMNKFPYDGSGPMDQNGMIMANSPQASQLSQMRNNPPSRQNTGGDISLNTNFSSVQHNYSPMMVPPSAFAQSPVASSAMDMSMASPYGNPSVDMTVDYNLDPRMKNVMSDEQMDMNIYGQPQFNNAAMASPMHSQAQLNNSMAIQRPSHGHGASNAMGTSYGNTNAAEAETTRAIQRDGQAQNPNPSGKGTPQTQSSGSQSTQTQNNQPQPPALQRSHTSRLQQQDRSGYSSGSQNSSTSRTDSTSTQSKQNFDGKNGPIPINNNNNNNNTAVQGPKVPWETPEGGWPSTMEGKPHTASKFKNAYSSTGFDMLGVLMRVSTRPNPEINIGAVDLSCAFVVCDVERDDIPIVYCSENFERLTGYTKHMILGRNCRFLQSPDGNVAPGVKRKYVDDDSILYLKNMVNMRKEAQVSVINYRRGGQPFMNLLTMIPIAWDGSDNIRYFVGFQVDLVEQPQAVTSKNTDGSYMINYQRGNTMPRYIVQPPDPSHKTDLGQTVPRDDVSAILATINSGESDYAKRMWDKVLLENTDDVVHVLSLKGLFQWVSPSAARILEYEPSEIIGTALSSVCHPSDIVPVTRELKDTSSGAAVSVVFRIRRKNSGYMWFEGHGSLHTEQAKGRKSIIMVGRERPVYTLSKTDVAAAGGIGDNELWSKMSTSGMFLFVSQSVRQLLDRQPEELVGVSIQSLMRGESKTEFGRILEHARTGKLASVKHEMINKRGQVLAAFTTLYPGDATEGQKPTFIVAQTRLLKFSRSGTSGRPSLHSKGDTGISESMGSRSPSMSLQRISENGTPSSHMQNRYVGTDGTATTYSGQQGLVLGNQDQSLASDDNLFDELKTTKPSSWQYEIRQLERKNRLLAEEVQALLAAKKKRKRRKGAGNTQKDCANCHTKNTPEWRRGPSGERDLCNSCGLRWAKLNGKVTPRSKSKPSSTPEGPLSASHISVLDTEMRPGVIEPAPTSGSKA